MDKNRNTVQVTRLDRIRLVWSHEENNAYDTFIKPTDCSFIRDNLFVIADSETHSLFVYDLMHFENYGVMKSPIEIGKREVWPNGVASLRNNNVIVTDRKTHNVKVFDVETGKCVSKWKQRHMERPCGITVNSLGHVVVTDIGTHTVNVFSPDGILLGRGGSFGSNIQQLNLPFYCTTDNKDNIIISDNMNFALKIYDHNVRFLKHIGTGGEWGRRQFQCPYGVVVDQEGYILAADNENDKVFMFTPDGNFDNHLLVSPYCHRPSGLAIGPYGHLLLTETTYDHRDVKLFQLFDIRKPKIIESPKLRRKPKAKSTLI